MNPSVLYLQNRTHRAGAQTCLARLIQHDGLRRWRPVLVCSRAGWLTEQCDRAGVPVIREEFPSSRSLLARLFGNDAFVRRVQRQFQSLLDHASIVHANDHLEGLLGLKLAKELGARSAIFLRSPGMTRDDYFKYRCNEYGLIAAVGDELQTRAQAWDSGSKIELIHDGLSEEEFATAKPKPANAPTRMLVIGSHLDWKGWADLTEAMFQLEQARALPAITLDFTGSQPAASQNDLKLERLVSTHCNFIGRVDHFRTLVLGYDFVINPSRMESFGMAAIEVLAAGVPLLSSRTGVIEQVQESQEMLFPPHRPDALATALNNILARWQEIDFGLERCQENIRRRFMIAHTLARLNTAYDRLLARPLH